MNFLQVSSHSSEMDFGVDMNLNLGLDLEMNNESNARPYVPSCSQSPSEKYYHQSLVCLIL